MIRPISLNCQTFDFWNAVLCRPLRIGSALSRLWLGQLRFCIPRECERPFGASGGSLNEISKALCVRPERETLSKTTTCRVLHRSLATFSPPGWHLEFRSDVKADLDWIEVNEVADSMVGDATQLGPLAQGADGRLATFRE